jgi:hypothetical protein
MEVLRKGKRGGGVRESEEELLPVSGLFIFLFHIHHSYLSKAAAMGSKVSFENRVDFQ